MSYDICLTDPVTKETIQLDHPHDMRGGTYAVGGTTEAWLNITYNYASWYYKAFGEKGIRSIYGISGAESIPVLEHAIEALNQMKETMTQKEIDEEARLLGGHYWVSTKENALKPLYQLLSLARMRPDGIWEGD